MFSGVQKQERTHSILSTSVQGYRNLLYPSATQSVIPRCLWSTKVASQQSRKLLVKSPFRAATWLVATGETLSLPKKNSYPTPRAAPSDFIEPVIWVA